MYVRSWFLYLACVTSFTSSSAEARPERAAIVVGANGAAPGRQALRYAHEDADSVATVLEEVGGFLPEDVHLLHDPTPDELLSSLDERLARAEASPGSIVLFYYSGHSDEAAIYPSGRRLDRSALKTRLSDSRAEVRIGIIDACRGGDWTGAKGLVEEVPFSLDLAEPPSSEGTILIASSAGRESAHEAELVAGSFFTHHLVAGIRGAADTNDDARVTVTEAYAYARERTIRDAAIYAAEPQNPSFAISLKGRQDVLLAEIDRAPSRLRIEGPSASLEIIHVDTGTRVVETSSTDARLTLALPPGRYLVRTRDASPRRVREFRLSAGDIVALEDADLIAVGSDRLALKGNGVEGRLLASPRSARPTVAGGYGEISLALGVRHEEMSGLSVGVRRDLKGLIHATWGLGGGWTWTLPGYLAWSVGGEDSMQIVGSFGVTGFGVGWGSSDGLLGSLSLGAGLDVRTAVGPAGTAL